jgi:chemotaxis response regulator CheB
MAPKRQYSSTSAQSVAVKLEAKPEVKVELTADDVKEELQEQAEALSQRPSRKAKLEPKPDADLKAPSPAKRAPRKKAVKPEETDSKANSSSSTGGDSSSSSVSIFPSWPAPTPERCAEVHEALVQLHGAPLRTKLAETGTDLEKPASTQLVSICTQI